MRAPDGALLRTDRLTRSFGSLVAVNGVSLTVRKGELRSIIGPNGAGKATFFRLVSGEMAPSAGRVLFEDTDITGLPQHRVCRLGIARRCRATRARSTSGRAPITSRAAASGRSRSWPP